MKINKILLLLLLFGTNIVEGKVIIRGKLVNNPFKGYIYYNEPIDGYEDVYLNDKRVALKTNSTFTIQTQIKKEGFINIKLPGKKLLVFVHPNDTLSFEAVFVADKSKGEYIFNNIRFKGNNMSGNRLFALNPFNSDIHSYLLDNLFSKKMNSLSKFYENIRLVLQQLLHPIDSLYKNKEIDDKYYRAVTADIKSVVGWQIISFYATLLNFKSKESSHNKIFKHFFDALAINKDLYTNAGYDSARLFLYKTINPFDKDIAYSFLGVSYTGQYCRDLLSGLAKDTITYDSNFANLKSIEHFGYLKGRFLEANWKSYLYWMASTAQNAAEMEKNFKMFEYYFPKSPFLLFLSKRLGKAIKDRALISHISKEIHFINTKEYKSLEELVKDKFREKYVFVDLWATWCSPCIFEFTYKNEIKEFLEERKIALLYISIDRQIDRDRWKTFVLTKELNGYHFLASDAFIQDIKKKFYKNSDITIPRYLLVSKTGNVIGFDLPRPSNTETLKREINKLIDKKKVL